MGDYSEKQTYIDLIQVCEDFLSPLSSHNPEKTEENLLAKVVHVYNSVSLSRSIPGGFDKSKLKTDILRLSDLFVSIIHMNSVRKTNRKILNLIRSQGNERYFQEIASRHVLTSDNEYEMESGRLAIGIKIELTAHRFNLNHCKFMEERYSYEDEHEDEDEDEDAEDEDEHEEEHE